MSELQRLVQRYRDLSRSESVGSLVQKGLEKVRVYCEAPIKKRTFGTEQFQWQDKSLAYAVASYNATWRNERAIEVPILIDFLKANQDRKILELGNVSHYYYNHQHTVVDKYETNPKIINQDIMEVSFPEAFDGILSISTLEHVGWDETPRSSDKILKSLDRLKSFTKDADNVLFSYPTGYNDYLDDMIAADALPFQEHHYYIRVDAANHWELTDRKTALKAGYGKSFAGANGMVFSLGFQA